MKNFITKVVTGFGYGTGFTLALICVGYVSSLFIDDLNKAPSDTKKEQSAPQDNLEEDLEFRNVEKWSDIVNYGGAGLKEELIFTGELHNKSENTSYSNIGIEVDMYNSENVFIYKCRYWSREEISLEPGGVETIQVECRSLPKGVAEKYASYKVLIKRLDP